MTPPGTAFELHEAWPEMELVLVAGAGHSMYDPPITHHLVEATDVLKQVCQTAGGGRAAGASSADLQAPTVHAAAPEDRLGHRRHVAQRGPHQGHGN